MMLDRAFKIIDALLDQINGSPYIPSKYRIIRQDASVAVTREPFGQAESVNLILEPEFSDDFRDYVAARVEALLSDLQDYFSIESGTPWPLSDSSDSLPSVEIRDDVLVAGFTTQGQSDAWRVPVRVDVTSL